MDDEWEPQPAPPDPPGGYTVGYPTKEGADAAYDGIPDQDGWQKSLPFQYDNGWWYTAAWPASQQQPEQ